MISRRTAGLVTLLFLAAGCGLLPGKPSAAAIAAKIEAAQSGIKTLHGTLVTTISGLPAGAPGSSTVELWSQRPKLSRVVAETGDKETLLMVSNGQKIWIYNSQANTYFSVPAPRGGVSTLGMAGGSLLPTMISHLLENHRVSLVGLGTVAGRGTYELRIVPRNNAVGFGFGSIDLWVDRQTFLPLEYRTRLTAPGTVKTVSMTMRYTQVAYNVAVPPGTFTFTPPPGAKEVASPGANIKMRRVTLRQAAKETSFRFLKPTSLPPGYKLMSGMEMLNGGQVQSINLIFGAAPGTKGYLAISEHSQPGAGSFEFQAPRGTVVNGHTYLVQPKVQRITVDGQKALLTTYPAISGSRVLAQADVQFVLDGTQVTVTGSSAQVVEQVAQGMRPS